jgi:hypothetical protein
MLILSSNDILELLDIKSPGTLTKWRSLGAGQAVIGRNKWDGRRFLEWWLSNIYDGACIETDGTLAEARRDYWGAKAERERMAADREKGLLVLVADGEKETMSKISYMISCFRNLPARVGGLLVGKTDRTEIANILNLETEAMAMVMSAGVPYSDKTADEAIAAMGGISVEQAIAEKVEAQTSMPLHMKYNPRKKVFTDDRDGTIVPLADAEMYVRKYPNSKPNQTGEKQNAENK